MSLRGERSTGNCELNPKCCYDSHDLECPTKFNPPLLSTPTDFCSEALAKRLPIVQCSLAKPKKLVIEREPPPLAKPTTSRHLKNYQRWCYIWRQTYNRLTTKRNTECRPPVMSSGETHRYKKEDKELFDRTVHNYYLSGYYIKNATWPDAIRPKPCGTKAEITEVITKRYERDFPEMKRQRYPNHVRNEMSLPHRKLTTKKSGRRSSHGKKYSGNFNWEEQWARTKTIEGTKEILRCDIALYGKPPELVPDNLILKPTPSKDGAPTQRVGKLLVPQLVFSKHEDAEEELALDNLDFNNEPTIKDYYNENRGPILRIRSLSSEIVLTFSLSASQAHHFIKDPSLSSVKQEYLYDDNQHFSTTTKCKDIKYFVFKNEGTTAIRYQWFRHPPNIDAERMLADSTLYNSLALERDKSQETMLPNETPEASLQVPKKPHLEFHFSQLPGVILPGQSLDFPIIFRSKSPGYFHETLYLLTHPRLSTTDGRCYGVELSGICVEMELAEKGNEKYETESLKRFLSEDICNQESIDLVDSILHRALSDVTTSSTCSLPYGRVTAESVFYAHNKPFYYYCGVSEKALELVRELVQMLVPKMRVDNLAKCHLSIQRLYDLVMSARTHDDLYWSHERTPQAEDLLEKLNNCMVTLSTQRMFAWPGTERRKYTACYANMVVTFDEILKGFDRLYHSYNAPVMKLIDESRAPSLVKEYLRQEHENKKKAKSMEGHGEVVEQNIRLLTPIDEIITEVDDVDECDGEYNCYWLSAFEENLLPEQPQQVGFEGQEKMLSLSDKKDETGSNETEETQDSGSAVVIIMKSKPGKEQTAMTLLETMEKQVKQDRREVLTEARVQLFEDMMCDSVERMLATVDSFNNMFDSKSSDVFDRFGDIC